MSSINLKQRIYEVVKSIPSGKVLSYGLVAKLADSNSPRYVGYALHHNPDPDLIPCHRVVNSIGRLAPGFAFGGPGQHRHLLEKEGCIFKGEKVDMKQSLWDFTVDKSLKIS